MKCYSDLAIDRGRSGIDQFLFQRDLADTLFEPLELYFANKEYCAMQHAGTPFYLYVLENPMEFDAVHKALEETVESAEFREKDIPELGISYRKKLKKDRLCKDSASELFISQDEFGDSEAIEFSRYQVSVFVRKEKGRYVLNVIDQETVYTDLANQLKEFLQRSLNYQE